MTKTDLQKKTKAELLEVAKQKGISLPSSAKKEEIIEQLLAGSKTAKTEGKAPAGAKKTAGVSAPSRSKKSEAGSFPVADVSDPVMAGESKKFEIEDYRQPRQKVVPDLSDIYDIPESYNEDRLTLLVQDPYWIHAYWDISEKTRAMLSAEGHQMVIRVFYGERQTMDIEVNLKARSWYINVPVPRTGYRGELGYLRNGVFISLTGSNHITVPTDKAIEKTDSRFSGEDFSSSSVSFRSEEAIRKERQEKLFERSGGYVIHKLVGSEVVSEWVSAPSGLSSGQVSSGSGGMVTHAPRKRKFWAELHTELIVYGATEPTAKATLGGVPIQLTQEGTFSIRFYLKDGAHSVPFVATSEDGVETIEITPYVNKYTTRDERLN